MTVNQMQYEDVNDEAALAFWSSILKLNTNLVDIEFNTETATVIASDANRKEKNDVVKLNFFSMMIKWDKLSDSWVSDDDYEKIVSEEAKAAFDIINNLKPKTMTINSFNID